MKATHLLAAVTLAALVSCGQSNNPSASSTQVDPLDLELSPADAHAKGGNTCLLAYAEKYDELLTKDMVASASGADAEQMTSGYQKIASSNAYHDVAYSWKGTLEKTVGGMTFPMDDYVKLTGIDAISLFSFQSSYRAISEEQTRKLNNDMNEALDGNTDNSVVNQAIKKLDDMGISKEEQQEMMKGLTESAQKMTAGFTAVHDLGDAATWNSRTNTLYVFEIGAMFELVVELSDGERNLETATKLAKQILAKCK